eukprot:1169099-Rhodomonas_salina.1
MLSAVAGPDFAAKQHLLPSKKAMHIYNYSKYSIAIEVFEFSLNKIEDRLPDYQFTVVLPHSSTEIYTAVRKPVLKFFTGKKLFLGPAATERQS